MRMKLLLTVARETVCFSNDTKAAKRVVEVAFREATPQTLKSSTHNCKCNRSRTVFYLSFTHFLKREIFDALNPDLAAFTVNVSFYRCLAGYTIIMLLSIFLSNVSFY